MIAGYRQGVILGVPTLGWSQNLAQVEGTDSMNTKVYDFTIGLYCINRTWNAIM